MLNHFLCDILPHHPINIHLKDFILSQWRSWFNSSSNLIKMGLYLLLNKYLFLLLLISTSLAKSTFCQWKYYVAWSSIQFTFPVCFRAEEEYVVTLDRSYFGITLNRSLFQYLTKFPFKLKSKGPLFTRPRHSLWGNRECCIIITCRHISILGCILVNSWRLAFSDTRAVAICQISFC